jgi:hypothetical protein
LRWTAFSDVRQSPGRTPDRLDEKATYYICAAAGLLPRLETQIRPIDIAAMQFAEVQQMTECRGIAERCNRRVDAGHVIGDLFRPVDHEGQVIPRIALRPGDIATA